MTEDLLIFNANIRTMDAACPGASWVALRDGCIADLGSGAPPDATTSIDAGGRLVLPGFQDAHIHLLNGGTDLVETAPLYHVTTIAGLQSAQKAHADTTRGPIVWGAGWQTGFFGAHNLTRAVLDPSIQSYHVRTYAKAVAANALTLRVAGACLITGADTVDAAVARLTALRAAHGSRDFHLHSAKFFLDGGLENRTAAMLQPYADASVGNAPLMFAQHHLNALFGAFDAARFQIHCHCIGDAATDAALNGFQAARAANGTWPSLHQVAHVEVVAPADRARFAALGVMANMQPLWAAWDPEVPDDTMAMVGPDRMAQVYGFRSLIDAGAPDCLSSDWAVTSLNPFPIIATAVLRQPVPKRSAALLPAERITVEQAVLGYTVHAASACWRGSYTGQITRGYSADLILLDRDIFTIDPYDIAETNVVLTWFQGREVYRSAVWA